ncbi:MAG: hypothetical protein ACR5LD_05905 [Symbiopectobacterium sp.]
MMLDDEQIDDFRVRPRRAGEGWKLGYRYHGVGGDIRKRGRLTAEYIPLIRALLASGMLVTEVARKFETSKLHIYSIRNGKTGAVK